MTNTEQDGQLEPESTDRTPADGTADGSRAESGSDRRPSDAPARPSEPTVGRGRDGAGDGGRRDERNDSERSGGRDDDERDDGRRDADGRDDATDQRIRSLYWAALGVCALLALVALARFYASIETAIGVWVAAEYQPVASGAFNFAVLLVALVGVSATVRRLTR